MGAKEEIADLKAKVYVSDKEKTGKMPFYAIKYLYFYYVMNLRLNSILFYWERLEF